MRPAFRRVNLCHSSAMLFGSPYAMPCAWSDRRAWALLALHPEGMVRSTTWMVGEVQFESVVSCCSILNPIIDGIQYSEYTQQITCEMVCETLVSSCTCTIRRKANRFWSFCCLESVEDPRNQQEKSHHSGQPRRYSLFLSLSHSLFSPS